MLVASFALTGIICNLAYYLLAVLSIKNDNLQE